MWRWQQPGPGDFAEVIKFHIKKKGQLIVSEVHSAECVFVVEVTETEQAVWIKCGSKHQNSNDNLKKKEVVE